MKRYLTILLTIVLLLSNLSIPAFADNISEREDFYAKAKSQYGELDFSDPQFISDEDFFGKWDGSGWIKEPYFLYDEYPGLANVEAAAKDGNYMGCKVELLEYYREKYSHFNISISASKNVTDKAREQYEAAFNNFFPEYMNSISARMVFSEEEGWVTADLTSDVSGKANTTGSRVAKFLLVASEKDGYTVEIDTKEGGYTPYIKVLVNGAYRTYEAQVDTYVCGLEPDKVQGNESKMYVEESVSSIGKYWGKDEYTKNALLQFEFADLDANDKITEATLYLHGRKYESDTPGGVRKPSDKKSIYVMPFIRGNTRIEEDTLTDSIYKSYDQSYFSVDGEVSPHYQLAPGATKLESGYSTMITPFLDNLLKGYIATEDENFAWHSIRIISSLIRMKGDYENSQPVDGEPSGWAGGTFYNGQMGYTLPKYLYYYINSEYMTPDMFTMILKHLWEAAKYQVNMWSYDEEANNVGFYATQGLCAIGMYYPEFAEAHKPIEGFKNLNQPGSALGGWIEVAKHRFAYKVKDDIREGGTSVEISLEYATEILENLFAIINIANEVGAEPADYFSEEMIEMMEEASLYILSNTNPRFGDWQYGDCGSYYGSAYGSRLAKMLELKDNPYIEYFATGRKSGTPPEYLTYINDTAGKVTFRNSWEENAVAGHLEATSGQGTHGHTDDLSLTVAAYGQYLLVDPMMGNYETHEVNEAWLSSTRGHNTVEINNTVAKGGKSYTEVEALERYEIDGVLQGPDYFGVWTKYPNARANKISDLNPDNRETNAIYDFVRGETFGYTDHNAMDYDYRVLRDTLFIHRGYFIVTDYLIPEESDDVNSYKQLWHFMPEANISIDEETDTVQTNFDGKADIVIANVDTLQETKPEIHDGVYATYKNNFVDAKYAYFEKNIAGQTSFNTLLYTLPTTKEVDVFTKDLTLDVSRNQANSFEARIADKQGGNVTNLHYYNLFDESVKKEREFGSYMTDGILALSEESASGYNTAVLRRGKVLQDKLRGNYLIYSTDYIEDLGVEWNGDEIKLSSAHINGGDKIQLESLTIFSNNKTVRYVYYNGEKINFRQSNGYVYFGEEPILEGEEDSDDNQETTEQTKPDPPIHGGGGGSGGGGSSQKEESKEPEQKPQEEVVITPSVNVSFYDVKGHWAEDSIVKAAQSGIIKGDGKGCFNPDGTITRAELVAIVVRALGEKEVAVTKQFSDVIESDWYAMFVSQALAEGLVSDDALFRPNAPITREEMCKILVGFAIKMGKVSKVGAEALQFSDTESISSWAKDYVAKASGLGLINGMGENCFMPKETATRAQVVTVIDRIMDN